MSSRKKIPASPASAVPREADVPPSDAAPVVEAKAPSGEKDPFAAIVRAQEGQLSAEGFWKSAGRFARLR